ncbi:MAG: RagB/SusD family nutrient uptake outer membrane protein [Bacteroidota bacterium]
MFIGILHFSCSLEEEVFSSFDPDGFFETAADAELGLVGIYNGVGQYYQGPNWFGLVNLMDDHLSQPGATADRIEFDEYEVANANLLVENGWRESYSIIARANLVIERVAASEIIIESDRNRVVGQARFLRALAYFNLVRLYGEVPLIVEFGPVNNDIAPSPVGDIYTQMIEDLTIAESSLSPGPSDGFVSQGGVQSLLAKVYLYNNDYTNALSKAEAVINSGVYSLVPDFYNLWLPSNENSSEHIFSAQFNPGAITNSLDQFVATGASPLRDGAFGSFLIHEDFFTNYPDDDYRKSVIFLDEEGIQVVGKFLDQSGNSVGGAQGMNIPIIRYADVLLIAAEAENELNGPDNAYQYINEVRTRARNAGGTLAVAPADLSGLTQADFRNAVYRERELELCFEGQRWFDLVRQGQFVEVLGPLGATEGDQFLPYPQIDLEINDMLQ